jgi:hypothetical protein
MIIERLSQRNSLTTNRHTVFIDRGSADGVRVGDTFYIINQRDEFIDKKRPDPTLPPSAVGRLVVVDVKKKSATAVITDSSRAIVVGDTISQHID